MHIAQVISITGHSLTLESKAIKGARLKLNSLLYPKLYQATGQRLDANELIEESKEVMRYVYRHTEMMPQAMFDYKLKESMVTSR